MCLFGGFTFIITSGQLLRSSLVPLNYNDVNGKYVDHNYYEQSAFPFFTPLELNDATFGTNPAYTCTILSHPNEVCPLSCFLACASSYLLKCAFFANGLMSSSKKYCAPFSIQCLMMSYFKSVFPS